jgi:DNA-binding transcriptional ArsR family regulator
VLRIHFTPEDLTRTRVAGTVDPLWEMVFSRLRLCERDKGLVFEPWVRQVRREARLREIKSGLQILRVLSPLGPYFPDFLTPPEGVLGLKPAIEAIRATPRSRLSHELQLLSAASPLPNWTRSLAAGNAELLKDLGDALTAYHRVAIEPHSDTIEAVIKADRAHRSRVMLDRGVEGLLLSMRPLMHWRLPVLEVQYHIDRDLHLGGRGLRLVPSYFCQRVPVALADPDLPPTLVYPVNHDYAWKYDLAARRSSDQALAALLGSTRAAVLIAVDGGATTTELARRLGTSLSSISRHTTVLRDAGLITTYRQGVAVLHTMTPLGAALTRPNQQEN